MNTPPLDRPTDAATTLTALRSLVDDVAALVEAVDEDTWTAASPCPELPVDQLVEHLTGGLRGFTRVARREGKEFDHPTFGIADAARVYRGAGDASLRVWSMPGRIDQVFAMPWGDSPGRQLVGFLVLEQAVHGWDLARALGRPAEFDEQAVAVADAVAHAMVTDEMRVPGMFGPEVPAPPGASRLDRLAAFLGRRP